MGLELRLKEVSTRDEILPSFPLLLVVKEWSSSIFFQHISKWEEKINQID